MGKDTMQVTVTAATLRVLSEALVDAAALVEQHAVAYEGPAGRARLEARAAAYSDVRRLVEEWRWGMAGG